MAEEDMFGLVCLKTKTPVPLKDTVVEAEIRGYVLGLKSTLKYHNASTDPLEVVFRFPLEQSHAVVGLSALIDGHKIRAELKEKEEARMMYDDAIASGQTAALGEEKTADIFKVSLGNLPAGKEAEIELQLVGELPIDAEGEVRFSLPTALKPRYVPSGSTDPLAGVGGEQVLTAGVSSVGKFKLCVCDQETIETVTSPTHSLSVQREQDSDLVTVTLSESSQSLATDLVICLKHKQPHTPKALVEQGNPEGKDFMKQSALMINFFPEFGEVESLCCEFLFLVDRSGSMSGNYINSARETLLLFLKSLPDDCHFNIIGFGSRYVKLFEKGSVPYSQATLDEAITHTKGMHANLGGTELLPPLKDILQGKPPKGLSRQVFVLTDGSVSNTQACVDLVKKNVATARCFTFGIGSGASTALVEGLARAGNGSAEFIKGSERMQPKVIRSLKRAIQPAVSNVSVQFDLTAPKLSTTYQCPDKLPPVYAGEKLVVYGLVDVPQDKMGRIKGKAVLKGEMSGEQVKHVVQFSSRPAGAANTSDIFPVHRLAAKALIADWQDAGRSKEDIVSVSVESSVISRHTAFIAVDEDSSSPVQGALQTWDIKSNLIQQDCLFGFTAPPPSGGPMLQYSAAPAPMLRCSAALAPRSKGSRGGGGGGFFAKGKKKKAAAPAKAAARNMYMDFESASFNAPQKSSFDDLLCMGGEELEGALCSRRSLASSDDDSGEELGLPPPMAPKGGGPMMRGAPPPPRPSAGPPPPPPGPVPKSSSASPTDILSSLISAQQADGSWQLSSNLSQILGKSSQELEKACPVDLKGSPTLVGVVWATVLVLAILEKKCKGQRDEWELIAMKANKWLKKQVLPGGAELSKFQEAARTLV